MRQTWILSAVLALALGIGARSALAVDSEVTTLGGACAGTQNAADWDTIFQCVGGVWQRSAYFFGNSSSTCDASHAGLTRYNAGVLQVCNGASWAGLAGPAAGAEGQVQFNSSGSLGADGALTWDNTNKRLGIGTAAPGYALEITPSVGIAPAGSTFGDKIIFNNGYKISTYGGGGIGIQGSPYVWLGSITGVYVAQFTTGVNTSAALQMTASLDNQVGLEIRAHSGTQTADLFDISNSSGAPVGGFFNVSATGNVGISTTTPQTKLDVNGTVRLAANAAQSVACAAGNNGTVALTSQSTLCLCKGGTASWVQASDGTTACTW